MTPNEFGRIVQSHWDGLANHYAGTQLEAFVVMPNHVHCIIMIHAANVEAIHELPLRDTAPRGVKQRRNMLIPKMVGRFKMNTAKYINEIRGTPGVPVWQRNYWEHVIRDEDSLNRIREYIINNPLRWHMDKENPNREGEDEFDRWLRSIGRIGTISNGGGENEKS